MKHFYKWWSEATSCNLRPSLPDVILGIYNPNDDIVIKCLNFCILFAKYFVYNNKKKGLDVHLYNYLVELKNRLEIENVIASQNDQEEAFRKQWLFIFEYL